jgi:glucosamine kinase
MSMTLTEKDAPAVDTSRRCYLGIDSGGTNTRAMLADETGTVWGIGQAGSANPNHYPPALVAENLRQAICMAMDTLPGPLPFSGVFMGASGVSTARDRDEMCAILQGLPEMGHETRVVVESDTLIGLTGGLAGRPGLVLVAGTGSACYGVNALGQSFLCGGWGAVADDVGSAPWIGVRAIQAAVLAQDGRIPPTRLREIVFDYLQLQDPRELIYRLHNQGLDRADFGRLAPLVLEAYGSGDAAAAGIVREAVAGLATLVRVTKDRLFGEANCEMILVGGLALSGFPFQPLLQDEIRAVAPGVLVCEPELSPVQGAVLEAMRLGGVAWSDQTVLNLRRGVSQNLHV